MYVHIDAAMAVACRRTRERRKTRLTSIYALYDERDGGVRYVGKTSTQLYMRLARHRDTPTSHQMQSWLVECGQNVRIKLLELVWHDEWESAERGWIHWFRRRGQLLNIDPGGDYRTRKGAPRALVTLGYKPPTSTAPGLARRLTDAEIAAAYPGVKISRRA